MAKFQLIEIDPETGDEDQLLDTGTWAEMEKRMDEIIFEMLQEWNELDVDRHGVLWSALRIQPAQ